MTIAAHPRPRRRGYLLVEMLILLVVLGIFALIAGKLMVTSIKAMTLTRHREETARRFDLAISRLRADVGSATLIESDAESATLRHPDGRTIVWRVEPEADDGSGAPNPFGPTIRLTRSIEGKVARSSDAEPATAPASAADLTQWEPLPAGIAFTADGPTLTVHLPSTDERSGRDIGNQITMISQLPVGVIK